MGDVNLYQEKGSQEIKLELPQGERVFVDLLDTFGNVLIHLKDVSNHCSICMSKFSSGIYMVMVSSEYGGIKIKKVIKP